MLDRVAWSSRQVSPPQGLDQSVDGDDAIHLQGEEGDKRVQLSPAQVHSMSAGDNLEWP